MKPRYSYRGIAKTDPGLQKTLNEDSYVESSQFNVTEDVLQRLGALYAIADGVSGQAGGELASQIAVETLRMYYVLPHVDIPPLDRLRNAFLEAHKRIEQYAREHVEYRGMGTTLTSVVVRDNHLYYGHVGDTRLYLFRNETQQLEQLTRDHSLVAKFVREGKLTPEEAAEENSNILEQALGCVPNISVDVGEYDALVSGDMLLLASDGLTDLVSDAKIQQILVSSPSLDDACRRLILKANQGGGRDNITVILIGIEASEGGNA
jgi:protein phosphatase